MGACREVRRPIERRRRRTQRKCKRWCLCCNKWFRWLETIIERIVDGIVEIVTAILHLDFCAALEGLVNGAGFGLGQAIFAATGALSLAANGARDAIARDSRRNWLQGQLEERFDKKRREYIEDLLQMDGGSFGLHGVFDL